MEELLKAHFDVYTNPGSHAKTTPYLLDLQSNLLDGLDSCIVIPLRSLKHFPKVKVATQLTPIFKIGGKDYLLETPKMGAVPQRVLQSPIASLLELQAEVTAALEFLFQGH